MSDSDSSHSDLYINIDPDVAAAYNRGPDRVVHKGKEYLWRKHRALFPSLPSSGFRGDEYERTGNSRQKRFWRCGLWIMREFNRQRLKIKGELTTARSRIHVSFDGWTSFNIPSQHSLSPTQAH